MTIPIPTIDDFDTSTVMTTIREVVDYLIGMVPQINNGDITDLQTSYTNNILTITLVKGDGSTISKNVTIHASGGESPYPTDVALSLSGTVLNCDITLSNNTHVTGSQDLATFATDSELQGIKSDLQEQITAIKPTVTVDDSVSPPTISVAVNGTTSTVNLPESAGLVPVVVDNLIDATNELANTDHNNKPFFMLCEPYNGRQIFLSGVVKNNPRFTGIIDAYCCSQGATTDAFNPAIVGLSQDASNNILNYYSVSSSSSDVLQMHSVLFAVFY